MPKIGVFCEDSGHEVVIKNLITKIIGSGIDIISLSVRHGKGRALSEMEKYLKQVEAGSVDRPDAIVIAIDANCKGYNQKKKEINDRIPKDFNLISTIIYAIPDPHVEKWMLLDSKAFKTVFGKGCSAPAQKCEKDKYKILLNNEIRNSGGTLTIGWLEHAEDLIKEISIDVVSKTDDSIKKFINEICSFKKKLDL